MSWETCLDNLAPVVRSELSRGNRFLYQEDWRTITAPYGRGETEDRLDLYYQLDVAAIEAEFELPGNIYLYQGRLIREGASNAVIDGKHEPDEDKRAGTALCWQRWEAQPRARTLLAPTSSGPATIPGGSKPSDGTGER